MCAQAGMLNRLNFFFLNIVQSGFLPCSAFSNRHPKKMQALWCYVSVYEHVVIIVFNREIIPKKKYCEDTLQKPSHFEIAHLPVCSLF